MRSRLGSAAAAALAVVVGAAGLPSAEASAAGCVPGRAPRVLAFLQRFDAATTQRINRFGTKIAVLAPQWYSLDVGSGRIEGGPAGTDTRTFTKRFGTEIWPVVNGEVDDSLVFDDAAYRARLINTIVPIARAPYHGVTIDIEGVPAESRAGFTAFIADLGRVLHKHHKKLSVYVPRRDAVKYSRYTQAFDWAALSRSADVVLASSYSESFEVAGPLVTRKGFSALLGYSASISCRRVAPVLGTIAYSWADSRGTPESLLRPESEARRKAAGAVEHVIDGAGRFDIGSTVVWRETDAGLSERAAATRARGLAWISLFSFGEEAGSFWTPFPRIAAPRR